MTTSRKEMRKKKFKRRLKIWGLVAIAFFLVFTAYVIYEYQQGRSVAQQDMADYQDEEQSEQYRDEFQGDAEIEDQTNVLILGVDAEEQGNPRTDAIMIGQYDTDENRAKVVSIMRDTYVDIPGHGRNKINAAFAFGGPELLRQTIKENFGVDVNYYAMVNFRGFENIVNTIAPSGIEIDVERRMHYVDRAGGVHIDLQPGLQKLDGENLLDYVRFRSDSENDFGRVRRQQQVMSALKGEILSFTGASRLPRAVGTLEPYVDTNMETGTIISIMTNYFSNTPDEIESLRIPVEGSYWDARYSHAGQVLEIDSIENSEALQSFLDKEENEDETGDGIN
ncbi:LCP family protein required for cell wall assembly [Alkalibacillus filiformis]|uniref:Regulatory protein MsrR n=1 Tax=Alkalibacillus filiformis TaxID=200990 RepID=A0ABU0DW46_9BACI|nr:LCP family protein [Alkalibacillus filiformis]MDQ0352684.1 LCP family protein required for cell wall assembly [Alkalibacillus filiformis]